VCFVALCLLLSLEKATVLKPQANAAAKIIFFTTNVFKKLKIFFTPEEIQIIAEDARTQRSSLKKCVLQKAGIYCLL
jgi:hypothetical protein